MAGINKHTPGCQCCQCPILFCVNVWCGTSHQWIGGCTFVLKQDGATLSTQVGNGCFTIDTPGTYDIEVSKTGYFGVLHEVPLVITRTVTCNSNTVVTAALYPTTYEVRLSASSCPNLVPCGRLAVGSPSFGAPGAGGVEANYEVSNGYQSLTASGSSATITFDTPNPATTPIYHVATATATYFDDCTIDQATLSFMGYPYPSHPCTYTSIHFSMRVANGYICQCLLVCGDSAAHVIPATVSYSDADGACTLYHCEGPSAHPACYIGGYSYSGGATNTGYGCDDKVDTTVNVVVALSGKLGHANQYWRLEKYYGICSESSPRYRGSSNSPTIGPGCNITAYYGCTYESSAIADVAATCAAFPAINISVPTCKDDGTSDVATITG